MPYFPKISCIVRLNFVREEDVDTGAGQARTCRDAARPLALVRPGGVGAEPREPPAAVRSLERGPVRSAPPVRRTGTVQGVRSGSPPSPPGTPSDAPRVAHPASPRCTWRHVCGVYGPAVTSESDARPCEQLLSHQRRVFPRPHLDIAAPTITWCLVTLRKLCGPVCWKPSAPGLPVSTLPPPPP